MEGVAEDGVAIIRMLFSNMILQHYSDVSLMLRVFVLFLYSQRFSLEENQCDFV